MSKIKKVLIVGGTHGNEVIGVHLIEKFERYQNLIYRPSFETLTLVGNPKAVAAGRRYIDKDLNRCFNFQELGNETPANSEYEYQRAREIKYLFGQKGQKPIDVTVDLHSSTANMGTTLILDNHDPFNLQLAAYLSSVQPMLKIYSSAASGRNQDSLRSLGKYGFGIEVGPIPQGVLYAELFQKTEALIYAILDYLEQYNQNNIPPMNRQLTLYQYVGTVDYPRNENGEIQSMIHPQIQFKDYEALKSGDPMFLTFDGEVIAYEGASTVYPVFINEAAYYEKSIAMCLTEKQQLTI
jgi:succinylglutamate desuccinylase